jgi:hypothetical protein
MSNPGNNEALKVIENEYSIVRLRHDGIIHVYYNPGTEITPEVQIVMLEVFMELTGGAKSLFIYEAGEGTTVTKEGREDAIRMESNTPSKATVVYVKNLAHKIIAEFYYKFNKPLQPYKVVTDFDEGIAWLKKVNSEINDR